MSPLLLSERESEVLPSSQLSVQCRRSTQVTLINVVNVSRDNGRRKYYSKFANAMPAAIIVN